MEGTMIQSDRFQPGDVVVYALHGRGVVISTESLTLNGRTEDFYKIRMESKVKKADVLVPTARAIEMGLRRIIGEDDLPHFFATLAEATDVDVGHFDWKTEEKRIHSMLSEGKSGLAKAVGHLHQTLRALPVTDSSAESTYKILRSQVQVEVTQVLKKHHKQVRNMINDALGGDYSRPFRKPNVPKFEKLKTS
jgi:RNA polymerase-interacting CarD/CdnL/TRCF family regulator